eukprot:2474622-Prymnesium_polylepis.1
MLCLVGRDHLLDRRADGRVLPIVVELDHAPHQDVARAARLLGELACAREDRLDVGRGRGRALAADVRQVHRVVERQLQLVLSPERTRVEPAAAVVVLVAEALPHDSNCSTCCRRRHAGLQCDGAIWCTSGAQCQTTGAMHLTSAPTVSAITSNLLISCFTITSILDGASAFCCCSVRSTTC